MPLPPVSPDPPGCRLGAMLSLGAALVWPLQAAPIALVLSGLLTGDKVISVTGAALIFVLLGALRAVLDSLSHRSLTQCADMQIESLRDEIATVEARASSASQIGGAGSIAALASEKAEMLRASILRYAPARMRASVLPFVILAITLWHSWAIALVLLIAGPLIPLFMALVGWAARDASERQLTEIGEISDILTDRLAALSDLSLIGAGQSVVQSFADASERLRDRTMAVLRVAFLSSSVLELFAALGVAMVAVWVGFSLLGEINWGTWGSELSPFAGIYLLLLAPEFFQPLRDLAAAWHDRAAGEAVRAEIAVWRNEVRMDRLGGTQPSEPLSVGTIRLRGLVLPDGTPVPDTDIAPGQSLAITGPSGVGKTTLLRVLAGLETPKAGQVLWRETVLDATSAEAWRAGLGWMPQAPWFLNRSLRHNIAFGAPLRPEVMTQARLDAVLSALPQGDQTPLGERGAGLSGGEARRVTLARALHGDPLMLLADEPTADLDADTARAVTDGLLDHLKKGGILIVATHDPELIDRLDSELRLGARNHQ